MQDHNEFVFRRKRKRIRIESLDTVEADTSLDQANEELDSRLIPEIAVLSEPAASSLTFPDDPILSISNTDAACSESVVTVEKFLRSVEAAPQTKPNAASLKKPRAYIRHRPARKAAKAPKQPNESPQIARSLFRAAVLADGDPLDTLVEDAGVSLARRPLKFVPYNKFASPSRKKPADANRGEEEVPRTRCVGHPSNTKARHHPPSSCLQRIPLSFVPLREAEAAYSAMFPRTRHGTHS